MSCLNCIISNPSEYHPICQIEEGAYKQWGEGEDAIFMDTNTLELYKGDKPEPATVAPQYRFASNTKVKALCLNVTHACQLRCKYCYLSHFYPEMALSMSEETAQKAIDRFYPSESKVLSVSFFGGEALLNFDVVKSTVEYVHDRYPDAVKKFSMTTNAVAMTPEIAEFLKTNNFSLIVSLDGPASLHNETRVYANQKDTYFDVIAGLDHLKTAGVTAITLRGTFLPTGKGTLLDRVIHLNALCDQGYGSGVSIEPACLSESCACVTDDLKFSQSDVAGMRDEYLEIADWMATRYKEGKPARFHNIKVYIDRLINRKQYATECGAGMGYLSVSPEGKIFACHREMSSHIGDLAGGGINEAERAKWLDNRYYTNSSCSVCLIRNVCGGPCREHNVTANNDICKNDPVSCAFYHNWIGAAVRVIESVGYDNLKEHFQNKGGFKKYCFVREGGGFGDIISMGGAALQLKQENPMSMITLCVPNAFIPIAKHLQGVDRVAGLGTLDYLSANRRARTDKYDRNAYPYFVAVPEGQVVDMWGPGYLHEVAQEEGHLTLTRSQLFAQEAGCKDLSKAIPSWKVSKEDRDYMKGCFETLYKSGKPVVALSPRGTDPNRSMSMELVEELLDWLKDYSVLYLDCQLPQFSRPHANTDIPKNSTFVEAVALAEQSDILITVDSAFLHIGAALRLPTVGVFTMTDPAPYKELYSTLFIAGHEGVTERCSINCNRSEHKGYSPACADGKCLRNKELTLDMIIPGIASALELGGRPEYQKYRLNRML